MITKLRLQNVKLEDFGRVNKVEVNLEKGLNIIPVEYGEFIVKFFKYFSERLYKKHRLHRLLKISPSIDKNDLSYIEIYCTYEDRLLKYSSTYADENIFTETLFLDGELIGHRDYTDDSLETGKHWDTFGEVSEYNHDIDAKILCYTRGGNIIENTIKDYLICDTATPPQLNREYIKSRLVFDDLDVVRELNELYQAFGFNMTIDKDRQCCITDHEIPLRIGIELQGSGFIHLLRILPEVIYCMKKNKNLGIIIPYYGSSLHFLVKKHLKNFLENTGLHIIATDWEEYIKREKGN